MKFERRFILDLYEQFHEYYLRQIKEESEWGYKEETSFVADGYSLTVTPNNSLYDVNFYPIYSGDLKKIFTTIIKKEYFENIKNIKLGYEVGAINGTLEIDISTIIESKVIFPNLEAFIIQTESTDTNMAVLTDGDEFDENGVCGKLLDSMPNVKKMVLLNSPSLNFFERHSHPLETLLVKTIYENNRFIENLANSKCFSNLKNLCFYDYDLDSSGVNNESFNTSFEHFLKFANSKNLPNLKVLNLLNLSLTDDQIEILKKQPLMQQLEITILKKQLFGKDNFSNEAKADRYWFTSTFLDKI